MINQKLVQQDLSRKGRVSFGLRYTEKETLKLVKDLFKHTEASLAILNLIQSSMPSNHPAKRDVEKIDVAIRSTPSKMAEVIAKINSQIQKGLP